jgi:hypothetical protein
MKCQDVLVLLPIGDHRERWEEETYLKLAAHIRLCTLCSQGITQLTNALIAEDGLLCDTYRTLFPTYYEAMHPVASPSPIVDVDVVEVALHLGSCAACNEEYQVLVELWKMEEEQL